MKSFFYISFIALIFSCGAPQSNNGNKTADTSKDDQSLEEIIRSDTTSGKYNYSILFAKIQDRVLVYVNDKEVYSSGLIEGGENLPLRVSLDDFVVPGVNDIKIELYNDPNTTGRDTSAEVYYELFRGKDPVDFAHEVSKTADIGLVLERIHQLNAN